MNKKHVKCEIFCLTSNNQITRPLETSESNFVIGSKTSQPLTLSRSNSTTIYHLINGNQTIIGNKTEPEK